ncbi:Septin-type G domain-containing protein [[Candida] zeylanoides]
MDQSYTFDSPSMASAHSPMINYRKDAKKGVKFTFMVVGESGTGKTTFINCLLNKKVMAHRYEADARAVGDTTTLAFTSATAAALPNTSVLTRGAFDPAAAAEEPGIALTETRIEMVDDGGQKLLLNIIDAPGFGDNLNNEMCFDEIESYLRQQFDLVLAEETRIRRNPRFVDTRVHLLLYFVAPTGHGLRETDIVCMKRLARYVNIIPVIAKADSFTEAELQRFKHNVRVDIEKFNVPTFQFDTYVSEYDEDDDYELIQECRFLARLQPFAVVSSEELYEVDGHTVRARRYPWGLIDVNNPRHSDFAILKSVILGSHLQDLKDLTHDFLYETYRTERLTRVTGGDGLDAAKAPERDHTQHNNSAYAAAPSMSNLAQLAKDDASVSSVGSGTSKQPSVLLEESELDLSLRHDESTSSQYSVDRQASAFKRLSIGPQRNQLRQISETVPYVLRHERILERQQKLEEMEMASAKELASRAAMLEQKAAELKAKERALLKQLEAADAAQRARAHAERAELDETERANTDDETDLPETTSHSEPETHTVRVSLDEMPLEPTIPKDETLTDLHSVVQNGE